MSTKKKSSSLSQNLISLLPEILTNKNQIDSYKRSVKKVAEYLVSNEFDLLLTITYDPRRLRAYTPARASARLSTWLYRQSMNSRDQDKELKYIVFPDISDDGYLLEFHVLLSGYVFGLRQSGIIIDGQLAYTVKAFAGGFTKARAITGFSAQQVLGMVQPYLASNSAKHFHGRRYWPSRTLDDRQVVEIAHKRLKASQNIDAIDALGVIPSDAG